MKKKTPLGMVVAIIILGMIIIALGLTLVSQGSPLDKLIKNYHKNYPDSVLTIQMLEGDNAVTAAQEVSSYCQGFNLEKFFVAQIDDPATQKSTIHVINPITGNTECVIDKSSNINTTAALDQNLLATINGEPIYIQEVNAVFNNIPEEQRTNNSMQDSMDLVINNKLLLQDASSRGVTASNEEVENAINTFMTNNGLSLDQLQQNLASAGSSMAAFRQEVTNNVILQKEVSDITKNVVAPSDPDMRTYYEANKQNFVTMPSAVTRQLLINANDSNRAIKEETIKAIGNQYNNTNFCELVSKYSEDLISVPRCGEYSFQQGQLLPEYEEVVFNSTPGTTKLVQTRVGFHIVQILNVTQSRELSYDEVKESISNYFVLMSSEQVLNEYIAGLREQAEIVSYI